jgi:hypothetical protein
VRKTPLSHCRLLHDSKHLRHKSLQTLFQIGKEDYFAPPNKRRSELDPVAGEQARKRESSVALGKMFVHRIIRNSDLFGRRIVHAMLPPYL